MSAPTEFVEHHVLGRGYRVHVPAGEGPFPTVLFLHGSGESGTDNLAQTTVGIGTAITDGALWENFIVVMPQKSDALVMWTAYALILDAVLKDVDQRYPRDKDRTYLTGNSQGGYGTWMLAGRLRWNFAAVAPVCGWGDATTVAETLLDTPTWAFHGDSDRVVHPAGSIMNVEWLNRLGGKAQISLLPGVDHNSWDHAYRSAGLAEWFLAHRLS